MGKYRLVLEFSPGADNVSAKVTDGIHIYLRGGIPFAKVKGLLAAVRRAKSDRGILSIGQRFGFMPPAR